uniref:phytol kinase n=1 Tax=Asterionellopsis glacialis TaxID=33640 RepID=A0A7S0KYC2_9STRA
MIHTLSAPLFMLFWPCFSMAEGARFFAAIVPFINAVRLFVAGSSKSDDDSEKELANAVSRGGNKEEALGGPFIYCIVLLTSILAFWRDSPVGIIALSAMAGGDGMADIVGRRLGKNNKWFFSPSKSVAGSLAFWGFSTIFSVGLVLWFNFTGCMELPYALPELVTRIALISAACSAIELQPYGDDNWTVPVSAVVLSKLFLT